MSDHLQPQSVSRCVLGEPTDADCTHLAACARCRDEVDAFEQTLEGLRGSIHRWSEREFAAVASPGFMPVMRPMLGAAGTMALILLFSIVGARSFQQRAALAPVFGDSDAELMDNVRVDMDRPVPRGMEPLQALP